MPPGSPVPRRAERPYPRVRTFHARHGRMTASTRRALEELGPHHRLDRRRNRQPLVLEVGCGHGQAALAFADAHPHLDVVATDVHTPGIAHLLQELRDRPRANVWVEHGDALDLLDHAITPGELAGVHVFFPDPWPKVRHHKRRFVRPDVVDLLVDRMAPQATLRVATDVPDYAAAAARVLDAHPALDGGPAARPSWRPRSGYEAKALDAGRTVVDLHYRRS